MGSFAERGTEACLQLAVIKAEMGIFWCRFPQLLIIDVQCHEK